MQNIEDLKLQDKIFTTFYNKTIPISEDCLYLNVFVPDGESSSILQLLRKMHTCYLAKKTNLCLP